MKARKMIRKLLHHENTSMMMVLVGIIVAVILVEGLFVRGGDFSQVAFIKGMNISNVLTQISATGIMALGMAIVMIGGGMDLSAGQMMSFAGSATAFLIQKAEWGEVPAMLFAVCICVIFQLLMGFIISRTKLEPFIVSLGFMSIYQGLAYLITNGSEITITGKLEFLGKTYLYFGDDFKLGMPVILLILLTTLMWLVLKYTKFGRRVYAVGGNEEAAYLSGISVRNFKLVLYGINGLFISIATLTLLSRVGTGNPLMGSGKEIEVIAAVVVGGTALSGGKGNMWGAFIGVLLLGCISNALNILGISPYYQYVMRGLLILIAILISYFSDAKKASVKKVKQVSAAGADHTC